MNKKAIACFIALALSAGNVQAIAAPLVKGGEGSTINYKLSGSLEVEINFSKPVLVDIDDKTNMKLEICSSMGQSEVLIGSDKITEEKTVYLDGKEVIVQITKLDIEKNVLESLEDRAYYIDVKFINVPCDIYSLKFSGAGFKSVEMQNLEISNYSKKVYINDTESFLLGDFDENGNVNEDDYKEILTNIDSSEETVINKYDLNRDGMLDITDLSFVNDNLGKVTKAIQIVNTSPIIDPEKVFIKEVENQVVTGTASDLFADDSLVTIAKDIISEDSPAKLELELENTSIMQEITIDSSLSNGIDTGYVEVYTEDGESIQADFKREEARSIKDTIKVSLGKQIAVKKVTIVVTGTKNNNNLVEIAKVEFLNNALDKVFAPDMNIPEITAVPDNEAIDVKWNHEPNVTAYEVKACGMVKGSYKEMIIQTTSNKASFKGLENYNEYKISIQSLNGDWESGFSKEITAIPRPQTKPDAPVGIKIESGYKYLNVTWSKHKNADRFNLFYRKAGTNDNFTKVSGLTTTAYTILNLENYTEYEVYLTAINDLGESKNSEVYKGKTININPPISPDYKLINTPSKDSMLTNHIVDVYHPSSNILEGDNFKNGSVVDGDYSSTWTHNDWDTSLYSKRGPIITFDDEYTIDTISLIARLDGNYPLPYLANIGVYDEESGKWSYVNASISTKNNNGKYAVLTLDKPVTAKKIQVNTSVYGGGKVSISELKFYHYDSLEDDVRNLFTDDLLIALKEDVTMYEIKSLRDRANSIDEVSGEYHPNRSSILEELKLAEDILNDEHISKEIFTLNQNINRGKTAIGITNDYQSLGLSVRAGEEIVIYVGTTGNSIPELAFTQSYGEVTSFIKTQKLKKGKNIIHVPEITNMDVEKGGNVYVRYTGSSASNNEIKIRVSGGYKIPHLNVYGLINKEDSEEEVKSLIEEYITDLEGYTENMKDNYVKLFTNKDENIYKYDEKTSVLNTTDIELDNITLTMPATAILKGINKDLTSQEEKVDRVYNSLKAFEQLMDIKYSERGLTKNQRSSSRINIKYQRMFIGAFMYASSHHVGIEFDSCAPLMQGTPYKLNEDGSVTKESGNLFGWGIAHEIGHITDMPKMTYGETSNNIIALLAQTFDDSSKSRLEVSGKYEDIYEKVTSNTVGLPQDVFVKLGMFWQLHLAYDTESTAKMLSDDNTFYGRLSKRYSKATADENKLNNDQLLIRFASDAAGKDLSEFFAVWGIKADNSTLEYLSLMGYEKEVRKIQYLNDDARRKTLANIKALKEGTVVDAGYENINAGDIVSKKEVKLNFNVNNDSNILGYEIYRNGQVVGFTTDNTYTDYLGALNNRALEYEVIAYDYYLNKTEVANLGEIKVSHDGTFSDKSKWKALTNASDDEVINECEGDENHELKKIIDNDLESTYIGTLDGAGNPYVTINTSEKMSLSGIRYTCNSKNPINEYEVYVSLDNENWTLASSGKMTEGEVIYFNEEDVEGGKQLYTYDASYVKLVAKNARSIEVSEIDLITPPGDNININENSIGVLKKDYIYDKENGQAIPAGSIVVTGEYRGNPIYNVALLRDEDMNIISGAQVLLAEIPENGHLGEISSGTFIYWIAPEDKYLLTSKIKMELYRVNNAETNEGQRLVSDSLYTRVLEDLPLIEFAEDEEEN